MSLMRYLALTSCAVSLTVLLARAHQTPFLDETRSQSEEQAASNLPVCPSPVHNSMEEVYGQQYAFRCEDYPRGTIAAKCCTSKDVFPDGSGAFESEKSCSGSYHQGTEARNDLPWLPGSVRDYLGLRREAVPAGWETRNNCHSGYYGQRALCCKSNGMRAIHGWTSSGDWSADCSPPKAWGPDGLQAAPPACTPKRETNHNSDWKLHRGPQHTFDCDKSFPSAVPGSRIAKCCTAWELIDDVNGTVKALQGCGGYDDPVKYGPRWNARSALDWALGFLGLQEPDLPSVSEPPAYTLGYGFHTSMAQGNCGSGFDGRRAMCCKNAATQASGESWASECVPPTSFGLGYKEPPASEEINAFVPVVEVQEPEVLGTNTAFSCKSTKPDFRKTSAVCCPPSVEIVSEFKGRIHRVNTPGCTYGVRNGWTWRIFGNVEEADFTTTNDCGPSDNGWTGMCCEGVGVGSKPRLFGIADEVVGCSFAPQTSVKDSSGTEVDGTGQ